MEDLIIVGAGAAGCSAAIYAQRRGLKSLLLTKNIGGQVNIAGDIYNYLSYDHIGGVELAERMKSHLDSEEVRYREDVEITKVEKEGHFTLTDKDDETYEAKAVIWTTGSNPKKLQVPGEEEYANKGVSYCAVCDGALFKGKTVAVVGGGYSAIEASIELEHIADKIYILNIGDELSGEGVLLDKVRSMDNKEIINNADTREIHGEKTVTGITYEKDGEEKKMDVDGVFVMIGRDPIVGPVEDLVDLDNHGHIRVNRDQETKTEGLYAAGDCTDMHNYQICTAAGEGCTAFLRAAMRIQSR